MLEYCAGGDLGHFLRKHPCQPEKVALRILQHVARGLACLHNQNIIHRDLKPQNVLMSSSDPNTSDFKLADLGFARQVLRHTDMMATICGSPLYMAPEILKGNPYSGTCDLWSIGCILYEVLFGGPPYTGRNHIELLNNIAGGAPSFKRADSGANNSNSASASISQPLYTLLSGLLQSDPSNRLDLISFYRHPLIGISNSDLPKSIINGGSTTNDDGMNMTVSALGQSFLGDSAWSVNGGAIQNHHQPHITSNQNNVSGQQINNNNNISISPPIATVKEKIKEDINKSSEGVSHNSSEQKKEIEDDKLKMEKTTKEEKKHILSDSLFSALSTPLVAMVNAVVANQNQQKNDYTNKSDKNNQIEADHSNLSNSFASAASFPSKCNANVNTTSNNDDTEGFLSIASSSAPWFNNAEHHQKQKMKLEHYLDVNSRLHEGIEDFSLMSSIDSNQTFDNNHGNMNNNHHESSLQREKEKAEVAMRALMLNDDLNLKITEITDYNDKKNIDNNNNDMNDQLSIDLIKNASDLNHSILASSESLKENRQDDIIINEANNIDKIDESQLLNVTNYNLEIHDKENYERSQIAAVLPSTHDLSTPNREFSPTSVSHNDTHQIINNINNSVSMIPPRTASVGTTCEFPSASSPSGVSTITQINNNKNNNNNNISVKVSSPVVSPLRPTSCVTSASPVSPVAILRDNTISTLTELTEKKTTHVSGHPDVLVSVDELSPCEEKMEISFVGKSSNSIIHNSQKNSAQQQQLLHSDKTHNSNFDTADKSDWPLPSVCPVLVRSIPFSMGAQREDIYVPVSPIGSNNLISHNNISASLLVGYAIPSEIDSSNNNINNKEEHANRDTNLPPWKGGNSNISVNTRAILENEVKGVVDDNNYDDDINDLKILDLGAGDNFDDAYNKNENLEVVPHNENSQFLSNVKTEDVDNVMDDKIPNLIPNINSTASSASLGDVLSGGNILKSVNNHNQKEFSSSLQRFDNNNNNKLSSSITADLHIIRTANAKMDDFMVSAFQSSPTHVLGRAPDSIYAVNNKLFNEEVAFSNSQVNPSIPPVFSSSPRLNSTTPSPVPVSSPRLNMRDHSVKLLLDSDAKLYNGAGGNASKNCELNSNNNNNGSDDQDTDFILLEEEAPPNFNPPRRPLPSTLPLSQARPNAISPVSNLNTVRQLSANQSKSVSKPIVAPSPRASPPPFQSTASPTSLHPQLSLPRLLASNSCSVRILASAALAIRVSSLLKSLSTFWQPYLQVAFDEALAAKSGNPVVHPNITQGSSSSIMQFAVRMPICGEVSRILVIAASLLEGEFSPVSPPRHATHLPDRLTQQSDSNSNIENVVDWSRQVNSHLLTSKNWMVTMHAEMMKSIRNFNSLLNSQNLNASSRASLGAISTKDIIPSNSNSEINILVHNNNNISDSNNNLLLPDGEHSSVNDSCQHGNSSLNIFPSTDNQSHIVRRKSRASLAAHQAVRNLLLVGEGGVEVESDNEGDSLLGDSDDVMMLRLEDDSEEHSHKDVIYDELGQKNEYIDNDNNNGNNGELMLKPIRNKSNKSVCMVASSSINPSEQHKKIELMLMFSANNHNKQQHNNNSVSNVNYSAASGWMEEVVDTAMSLVRSSTADLTSYPNRCLCALDAAIILLQIIVQESHLIAIMASKRSSSFLKDAGGEAAIGWNNASARDMYTKVKSMVGNVISIREKCHNHIALSKS